MINIALDGPAGSGKSTVAKVIANRLDILYLDTGAMYRACGLKCKRMGISVNDSLNVSNLMEIINLKIEYKNRKQYTILDGEDVSDEIRKPDISMLASGVSAQKSVRLKMVDMQRNIASEMDCVIDGRDIGSYVIPNTKYKFYVTADSKIRAERRYKELIEKGEKVDFESLHQEIITRDYNDSHRDFAPLVKADDAIIVDTSYMTINEVAEFIISKINENQ